MFQGAVPVNATETVALAPLQIIVVPLTAAVGRGFTFTNTTADVLLQPLEVTVLLNQVLWFKIPGE
ncbi:hypothetical protein BSF42_44470 [Flavobacterium sp. ACN6]|nr:hypothetical protein BSF42_44470 [Flavobacterium sp. ACN6]